MNDEKLERIMIEYQLDLFKRAVNWRPEESPGNCHKRDTIRHLHAIAVWRLFGEGPWLCDREACAAVCRLRDEMKLWEPVGDSRDTVKTTALGKELNSELMDVFIGYWDEWEIPMILFEKGLIDEDEMDELHQKLEQSDNPEAVLKAVVRNAYRAYCNSSKWLH